VANVHLVGLDTSKPNTTTGDLSAEQLNWLKADLAANRGKFTLVASHHPLLAPPPYDGGPPWDDYMVLQGASAREIVGASRDVRLCLSGHVPVNKVQQEGGIWYVSCATLAMYPCQFKIFSVSPQAIHVETLQISYDALVKKAKKIMETSRLAFQYSSTKPQSFLRIAEGEELDRNAILPLVSGAVSQQTEKKKGWGRDKGPKKEKAEKPEKKRKPEKADRASKQDRSDQADKSSKSSDKMTDQPQDLKPDLKPDLKSDLKRDLKDDLKPSPKGGADASQLTPKTDKTAKTDAKGDSKSAQSSTTKDNAPAAAPAPADPGKSDTTSK
jgi:hypothetical protein